MNLIYTISDKNYRDILDLCFKTIRKYDNVDFCYIAPCDLAIDGAMSFIVENFDYKFLSKFMISQWCNFEKYDNFLFIDSDIICCKNIDTIFNTICRNENIIHGVKEKPSLQNSDKWFKFSEKVFSNDQIGYNSGTFGFNKNMAKLFDEFKIYVDENKHAAICDQPLFNEFFVEKGMICDSLSEYVYLVGNIYKELNANKNNVVFRHYLGNYGNGARKFEKMKKDHGSL